MKKLVAPPLLLDGATGTSLQKHGMPLGACTEKWILEHPEAVIATQRAYAGAGSDMVYAPTFGANRVALSRHGVKQSVDELVSRLVELSREATGGKTLVAGDMSVTGLGQPPLSDTSFEELVDIFTEQAGALEDSGVDAFAVETQLSLREARAAVIAVRAVSEKPIFVSFTCGNSGKSLYGTNLSAALLALQDMGAAAFGVNCCGDLGLVEALLTDMKRFSRIPLIAKPNAGMPVMTESGAVYGMRPEDMASYVGRFAAAGASIIGGCCGTDETHVYAMKAEMEKTQFLLPKPELIEVCASEYMVAVLNSGTELRDLELSGNIGKRARAAEDDGAEVLYVRIRDENDIGALESHQHMIKLPLCIDCVDGELLSRVLRVYHGKPLLV